MTIVSFKNVGGGSSKTRDLARDIYLAGVAAVQPERLLPAAVRLSGERLTIGADEYRLENEQKVYLFGSGKASISMARVMIGILGDRLAGGCIVSATEESVGGLEVIRGGHPLPDAGSLKGGARLLELLSGLAVDDLFIYLLSGGSSALIEVPLVPLTLAELQETSRLLLQNNVPIREVNAVRKHLSGLKGGRLGQVTEARGVVLVISDVVGDDLETIGSGPLYGDSSTYGQTLEILGRAGLESLVPPSVLQVLREGAAGERPETPLAPGANIRHYLLGSNRVALEGAGRRAAELGFEVRLLTSRLEGEAETAAGFICSLGMEQALYQPPPPPGLVMLFGGETTVRVTGSGRGGRNQQLALAALARIAGEPSLTLLAGGTDGIDGNSEAAGAVADAAGYRAAAEAGLEIGYYLENNDATTFFKQIDGLVVTGPTGTNVMDLILLIVTSKEES